MVRSDQDENLIEGEEAPTTGSKSYDRRIKKHKAAYDEFNLQSKYTFGESGLVEDRRMTDITFLLIFLLALSAMIGLSGYGISKGNPGKLIAPYDGAGNLCGFDAMKDFPKVYLTHLLQPAAEVNTLIGFGLCVKVCPADKDIEEPTWWKNNCEPAAT